MAGGIWHERQQWGTAGKRHKIPGAGCGCGRKLPAGSDRFGENRGEAGGKRKEAEGKTSLEILSGRNFGCRRRDVRGCRDLAVLPGVGISGKARQPGNDEKNQRNGPDHSGTLLRGHQQFRSHGKYDEWSGQRPGR